MERLILLKGPDTSYTRESFVLELKSWFKVNDFDEKFVDMLLDEYATKIDMLFESSIPQTVARSIWKDYKMQKEHGVMSVFDVPVKSKKGR